MPTLRFRPRWQQLPWLVAIAPFAVYGTGPRHPLLPDGARGAVALAVAVLVVAELAWLRTTGVDLRPDALVLRGVRRRVVPWSEVGWVGPTSLLGARTVGVTTNGRLRRLRAPTTGFLARDPEFDAKLATIVDYWRRATSAGSAP